MIYSLFFTARQYSVGFEVVTVSVVGDPGPHGFQRRSSGDYRYCWSVDSCLIHTLLSGAASLKNLVLIFPEHRCGFCYLELENIPAGIYNIIPSTFLPKQEGPFFLDFNSIIPIKTTQLQ